MMLIRPVVPEITEILREVDAAKYLLYTIWILPIFRVYKALSKEGLLLSLSTSLDNDKALKSVTLAIFIPARNASKYISDVIKSVVLQSVRPRLVVIVDDMSEDRTFTVASNVLKDLGGKVRHVTVEGNKVVEEVFELNDVKFVLSRNLEHLGKARSLNRFKDLMSKYDYIMILDSDTVLERNYIEKVLSIMVQDPSSGAAGGLPLLWDHIYKSRLSRWIAKAFREASFLVYALTVKSAESKIGALATLNGCCMIVRTRALEEVGWIPEKTLADDTELSLKLGIKGYRLLFVPEALAYTVDPGEPLGLFKKLLRVYRGTYVSFFRLLPEMLKERRWGLLMTAIYNIFGGIPFTLSLMNVIATTILATKGYLSSSFLLYLASLLQFSSLSLILNMIARYPLILLVLSYLWGTLGAVFSLMIVSKIYSGNEGIPKTSLRAIKYSVLVPAVLWIQALAMILALVGAFGDLVRKGEAQW